MGGKRRSGPLWSRRFSESDICVPDRAPGVQPRPSFVVASGALDRARLAALDSGLLALAAILAGIPAATRVARASGRKDPQFVVIDEVAGQLITLIAAPIAWQSLLLGFILFRGFDIVKPWPVRRLERLPEGVGIVVDDVAAGLYGLAVMQIALHFGLLPR